MKKFTLLCTTLLLVVLALNTTVTRGLMNWFNTPAVTRAEISGKDGELTVTAPNTIVNKYAILAGNASKGAKEITITNPGGPNGLTPGSLEAGDLIMLIQMSGAAIDSTNTVNYGNVTDLKNAGRHEFITVNKVQGNTITLNPPCVGLKFDYVVVGSEVGKVQVIRVPQYTKLTINNGASLTAPKWNGSFGGIVVVDVQSNAIINGTVNVTGLGFRGGDVANVSVATFGKTDYATVQQNDGAQKGESIVGFQNDYDPIGGRFGRGAPANGGGGGTSHNSGGGGGANGNNGKAWTGQGVMDGTVTGGATAWPLDPGYAANGNKFTDSSGGGRGGYSYATNIANPLTQGPGNNAWGGDVRREVGGLGGRPVAQDTAGRLFFGGGGGAGHQNNDAGGKGGDGGGLIYIIAESISGSGSLIANGIDGGSTRNTHQDGAGGGGGGGTIVIAAKSSLAGISAQANGGKGGDQFNPVSFPTEAEGSGGGGGGGFIAYKNGTITTQVNGGANGVSQADPVKTFPANGATRGAGGLVITSVDDIPFCSTTTDLSITKTDNSATAVPGVPLTYVIVARNNGPNDVFGIPVMDTLSPTLINASWTCTASAGSACSAATGTGSINTTVSLLNGGTATFNLTVTPNPSATGTITNTATVMMPGGAVDTDPTNDSASDTNTLLPQADLSITKTDGVTTVTAGTPLTYTITVRNNGPSTVNGATVTDNVPVKLTNVLWTCTATAGGSCAVPSGGGSINTTVNLLPGSVATFKVNATVVSSATGSLTNTATVTSPGTVPDPQPNNNSDADTDTIVASGDLTITKTNNATVVVPGTQTTYTIVAGNSGPSAVTGAMVADTLPATLTNAIWTCTAANGATCGSASGTGSINATVDLPVGGTATFTLTARVASNAIGTLANTATIAAPPGATDPNSGNNSATDTDNVAPTADLRITKTNGTNSIAPGAQTTYTIVVSNDGPSAVTGAMVADTLPATLTNAAWTCTAANGATCGLASGTGSINATVDLPAGGSATFALTARVAANAIGALANTATVTAPSGVTDPNNGNNSATDTDSLVPTADLRITKTNGVNSTVPGTQTTYTIVVTNDGPSPVTAATVTDTLPSALTNAIWTCTATSGSSCGAANGGGSINTTVNLLSGGAATFSLTATVSSTASGTLTNTATVAPPNGVTDPNSANNSATDTDTLTPTADLRITKTSNTVKSVPGSQMTYAIVVTNNGPSAVSDATVTDNLPSILTNAIWTCTATAGSSCGTISGGGDISATVNLLSGGSATFTVTATISSTASGSLVNTATVAAPSGVTDPNPGNNSSTDTRSLAPTADLSVTKSNGTTTLVPGAQTTYTVVVTNAGPSAVTNAGVTDILPAALTMISWTCTASAGSSCGKSSGNVNLVNEPVSLTVGGTATFAVTVTVSSQATGTVTNTASVAAPNGVTDPNSANDSASDTDTLVVTADLAITKTDNATTVTAGNQVTYTIVVTNNGPSMVTDATVTDTLPAQLSNATWTCTAVPGASCGSAGGTGSINAKVTLAASTTATFTLTATIANNAIGTLSNTATITVPSGATDPTPGNNSATDTSTVVGLADLRIAKAISPQQPIPGTPLAYTLTVTNDGPSPVNGATVTDNIPNVLTNVTWTCTASSGSSCGAANGTGNINATVNLAVSGTALFTISANVPAGLTAAITNQASVAAPSGVNDPNSGNNTSTVTSPLQPTSDLSITKVADAGSIRAGDLVTYTITAKNNGPSDAANVVVTDPLPSGTTLDSATSTKGTCSGTATVTCNLGTLTAAAPDNTAVITLKLRVPFTYPPGPLTNLVSVSGAGTDPSGGNNNGSSTITVTAPPGALFKPADLTIRTTGVDVCIGGGNILNVEAKLKNTGSGTQFDNPGPEFIALLPTALTTIPGSCTSTISSGGNGTCTLGTAQVEWSGAIPVGATVTINYQVRVRQNIQLGTRFCTDFKVNYDTNSDGINDAQTVTSDCLTANCDPNPTCTGPNCPNVGPGLDINDPRVNNFATGSDQRPGSLLIFPIYTSDAANPSSQNTRLNFTNIHAALPAYLHLFFVDGTSCSVADNFLCLTPNQTTSFQISDLDPGVTGYIIAVAVDKNGCPANFNYLIGDEYVKFSTGHAANLGAEAVAATTGIGTDANVLPDPLSCAGSSIASLVFDGGAPTATERHYARLGRVVAASNVPSRADGNDTMLIVNRIGGNLGLGAASLGSLFGIFYDDAEASVSFTFNTGNCQFRSSLSNNFPRTTPRFEQFVPAGRSSWLKMGIAGTANDGALTGAVINSNLNANGFKGGHNLHKLTLSAAVTLTMPVFPPSCQ